MNLIDPSKIDEISKLRKHEIAFPDIKFLSQNLNRNKTTLKAAYSTISKNLNGLYLNELSWDTNGDIEWQNKMLATLSNEIFSMIKNWKKTKNDDDLLKKIFVYIQLWGGNTSRGFFNINGGFRNNYCNQFYKEGVQKAIDKNIESLDSFLLLNQVGISFATKHMFFWSDKVLPIYDNIIAMIVFGRKPENNIKHYKQYVDSLKQLGAENNTETSVIERSIFNWYETKYGKKWFELRGNTTQKE